MFLDPITIAKFVANPQNRAKLAQTWPAKAARSIWEGVTLPGDVYNGKVDPLSEEAIKRATDLAGVNMLGTNFSAPVGALGAGPTRLANPIRAYHGSPYDFDKFDMTKIGTGEGAQVYGHGLYFAENPKVAQSYKDKIPTMISDEAEYTFYPVWNKFADKKGIVRNGISVWEDPYDFLKSVHRNSASVKGMPEELLQAARAAAATKDQGKLYDVNLHVKPEQLLDWDKAIPEQTWQRLPENVRFSIDDALDNRGMNPMSDALSDYTGRHLVKTLQHHDVHDTLPIKIGASDWTIDTNEKIHTAAFLNDIGIPGIQYLDQFSRNQKTDPTRNFVMFDPDLIEIVGKRATGGAVTEDDSIQTAAHIANKLATGGKVTGYLATDGNGRTDNLPMKVPNGAYVIPADIVSGLGQGNSLAGRKTLEEIFQRPQFATGGSVQDNDEGIDIIAAGGEYVIDPETVAAIADGDLDLGHEILDRFVVDTRKRIIKEMKSLPGPAQD